MEVHTEFALLFGWKQEYESKITKEAWETYTGSVIALLERVEQVHKARCKTGDLILQEVYDEILEKVATKIAVVCTISPSGCCRFRGRLLALAEEKKGRLELLWKVLDTGEHLVAQKELERLLEEEIRVLDLAEIIGGGT